MTALMTHIERLHLTTKLLIGFAAALLIALLIGFNALWNLNALEHEMESLYENDLLGVSYIKDANLDLIYMSRAMRHALIAQDETTRNAAIASVKRSREKLMSDLAEARKRMLREDTIARYAAFQKELNKALEGIEHALALIQKEGMFSSNAARFITSAEFAATIAAADGGLHELTNIKADGAELTLNKVRQQNAWARTVAISLIAAGIIGAAMLGLLIGVSIQRPNERLRRSVEELAAGETGKAIPHTDYPNEIGVMARAIQILQGIYRQSDEQHWVKSHVADISAELQQADDPRQLAQAAISRLAPAIGAGHGAFYVGDGAGQYSLQASYGYRERKHISSSFRIGEGLVGQCVMEKSPIVLTAPKDYIRIGSGLGEGPPACIMVQPVMLGDRVLGVLEMASFDQFKSRDKALVEALLPALATSIEILDRNLKTRELLSATQEQAERMERQAAQLEEQSVEMEAQQAELLETENWFRSIIESAPDGMLVADTEGRILLANPAAEALLGYAGGELIGTAVDHLVPPTARAAHVGMRASFLADGKSRSMSGSRPLTAMRKDGSELPVAISLAPLPPRGTRGACIAVTLRGL